MQRKQRNGGRREEKRQREEGVEQKCGSVLLGRGLALNAGLAGGAEKRARSQTSVGTLRMLEGARCHDQREHGTLIML